MVDGGAAEHTELMTSQELPNEDEEQEPEIPPPSVVRRKSCLLETNSSM